MQTFKHDLSFTQMGTGKLGGIYPVGQYEALPNDVMQIQSHGVLKFGTLVKDLKHRLKAKLVCTFTPIREVLDDDDHWNDFITGGRDGNDATTLDTFATTTTAGAVQDYLGIERTAGVNLLAYPLRCYSAFINNYIIDNEIQTEVAQNYDTIYYVNWAKDYFTTARTSPQLGTAVNITIGTTAPIVSDGSAIRLAEDASSTNPTLVRRNAAGAGAGLEAVSAGSGVTNMFYDDQGMNADLASATGMSIEYL